jgi:hypothetical protein
MIGPRTIIAYRTPRNPGSVHRRWRRSFRRKNTARRGSRPRNHPEDRFTSLEYSRCSTIGFAALVAATAK